ncbi:WD repeat-containing protein [Termitomyces sp. T112]|nr:WD repeat-containing protein [Termitomyces sp. T112]
MPKLSQYEKEREANIARNRALLEELELKQAVAGLGFTPSASKSAPKTKVQPVQPRKRVKKEVLEFEAPRRQSSRLKRTAIDPDESPSKRQKREAELELLRAQEAEERLEAEERARIASRPRRHDLELDVLLGEEEKEEVSPLIAILRDDIQDPYPRRVADPEAFTYDKDNKKEEAEVSELRERLQSLKIVSRAKVTQDRVYSAAYHPEISKDLVFFGDKHGQLGIWDARAIPDEVPDEDGGAETNENGEGGKYWRLQVHWPATSKSSISTIKMDPVNAHSVYTSSYDCSVRCLSFETGISRQVCATEDGVLISSIDLNPTGNELWLSDSLGGVTHLDLRASESKTRWYGLSEQKIGCISLNPTRPNFLLTASNNRSLKIWDTRKLTEIAVELSDAVPDSTGLEFGTETINKWLETGPGKTCLRAEWRHDKSVSSAYWDPRGRSIVSTSYDDKLRLWDISSERFTSTRPFPSSRPFGQLTHNCQTGKWLTILRAQWSPNPDVYPHFTIGNMNHSLDIFSCKGDLVARLVDKEKITAVQAVTCSHPNVVERAASGNASGRCVLWSIPSEC